MSYCTLQDLIDRYTEAELLQLADRDSDGEIDTDVVDRAIADADAELDGYLSVRYGLPLPSTPPIIARIACALARYQLYRGLAPKEIQAEITAERQIIGAIRDAKIDLGIAAGPEPESENNAAMSSTDPVWRRDKSGGFI